MGSNPGDVRPLELDGEWFHPPLRSPSVRIVAPTRCVAAPALEVDDDKGVCGH